MQNPMPPNPRYYMTKLAALIAKLETYVEKDASR